MRPSLAPLVVVASLLGCGSKGMTFEELKEQRRAAYAAALDQHGDGARARLEALRVSAEAARAAAPVSAFEASAAPVRRERMLVANVELLADPDFRNDAKVRLPREPDGLVFGTLREALSEPGFDRDLSWSLEHHLARLVALEHVALVRVHDHAPPRAALHDGERRFAAGRASGDVLIYDLGRRERIGAFPFEVLQHDRASIRGTSDDEIQRELDEAFARGLAFDVSLALDAFAEGKPGRSAPGAAAAASDARWVNKLTLAILELPFLPGRLEVSLHEPDDGSLAVVIRADTPRALTTHDGAPRPEIRDAVRKILGRDDVQIRIEAHD